MSLNQAAFALLREKGFTDTDIAEVSEALKRKPAPPPPLAPRPILAPTSRRKGSGWRAKVYAQLIDRDGPMCAECGCFERTIWRKAGLQNNDDWGVCEDGRCISIFSAVNSSSNLEVDHLKPLRDGGTNCLTNLWLLCVKCHKAKTVAEQSERLRRMFADAR